MKSAKSKGGAGGASTGISGLTQNHAAYQQWVRAMHEQCKYVDVMNKFTNMESHSSQYKYQRELRPIEIKNDEETVSKTVEAVKSFVNPFTIEDKENLYNITSGVKVSKIIENDVINAEKIGEDQRIKFITERLNKQEFFFDPIKMVKLKTMADGNKRTKVRGKQGKLIEIKQHGNLAFQLLIIAQNLHRNINLAEVLKYQLTPVPSSLGSPDGYLAKTNKTKSM